MTKKPLSNLKITQSIGQSGQITDEHGNVVAVDATHGTSRSFETVEDIVPFVWGATETDILKRFIEGDDPEQLSVKKLARATGLSRKQVQEIVTHPAFQHKLQLEQSRLYTSISAQRRAQISSVADMLYAKVVEYLQNPDTVHLVPKLLSEFRQTRQLERVEHGEAATVVASLKDYENSRIGMSVLEIIKAHPEAAAVLASALLDGTASQSLFTDPGGFGFSEAVVWEDQAPPSPPEFPSLPPPPDSLAPSPPELPLPPPLPLPPTNDEKAPK